ncbi:hypothetical protein SSS_09541 [Sarcoptes scabiei]|nr:hypothetical protein SSS_09541 [Sarcoptes scabiei]UXI19826.1 ninjurin-1-like protein [Sarcoptes scabiei]
MKRAIISITLIIASMVCFSYANPYTYSGRPYGYGGYNQQPYGHGSHGYNHHHYHHNGYNSDGYGNHQSGYGFHQSGNTGSNQRGGGVVGKIIERLGSAISGR